MPAGIAELLQDSSAAVRVAAARGLLLSGSQQAEAKGVLDRELSRGREWSRLAAMLALDEAGAEVPAVAGAGTDKNQYVARVAAHLVAKRK